MYSIKDIEKIRHDDGRIEVVPCDHTVELLALELYGMGLSFPVKEEDEEAISDRFTDMDAEIGQVESEGIRPTSKYNEQVCRAADEFNLDEDEYIDYQKLNERLDAVFGLMEEGTFEPYVKRKWRRPSKDRCGHHPMIKGFPGICRC